VIAGFLELPRLTTREDDGARRGAFRIRGEGIVEEQAFPGPPGRSLASSPMACHNALAWRPRVVGDREKDVGPLRFGRESDRGSAPREKEEENGVTSLHKL